MNPGTGVLGRAVTVVIGLALTATGLLAGAPWAPAAHASSYVFTPLSRFDENLVAHINRARANHGINRLIVAAGTTDVAHGWSCHMASYRILAHDPTLGSKLETHGSDLWTTYAENVGGEASSLGAKTLFRAYMNSPEHRANILDPSVRFVGIWTDRSGGMRYNTMDFVGTSWSSYDNDYGAPRVTC